jgi:hypothetical protein
MMDFQFILVYDTYYDFDIINNNRLDSKIKSLPKIKKETLQNNIIDNCLDKTDNLFLNKSLQILDFINCSIY